MTRGGGRDKSRGQVGGLVGLTTRKRRLSRVWRWARPGSAGGVAVVAALIADGVATDSGTVVTTGLLGGIVWLGGLIGEWGERRTRQQRMRAASDPGAPMVRYQAQQPQQQVTRPGRPLSPLSPPPRPGDSYSGRRR